LRISKYPVKTTFTGLTQIPWDYVLKVFCVARIQDAGESKAKVQRKKVKGAVRPGHRRK
jgi:hypothetical protein